MSCHNLNRHGCAMNLYFSSYLIHSHMYNPIKKNALTIFIGDLFEETVIGQLLCHNQEVLDERDYLF